MGVPIERLEVLNWEDVATIASIRFGMISLGGKSQYAGTPLERIMFSFRPPLRDLWWQIGVPGTGAQIDRVSKNNGMVCGRAANTDQAALRAMLTLWELTYRRALLRIP
jgi:hypothetical protein